MCGRTTVPKLRMIHLASWQNSFLKIVRAWTRYSRRPRAEAAVHGVLSGTDGHWAMLTHRAAVPANRVSYAQDVPKCLRHDRALVSFHGENAARVVSPRVEG